MSSRVKMTSPIYRREGSIPCRQVTSVALDQIPVK